MRLLVADDVVLVAAALLRSGRGCILGCGVAAVVVVVVVVVFALVVSRVVVLAVVVVVVVAVVHVRCGSVVLVDAVIGAAAVVHYVRNNTQEPRRTRRSQLGKP